MGYLHDLSSPFHTSALYRLRYTILHDSGTCAEIPFVRVRHDVQDSACRLKGRDSICVRGIGKYRSRAQRIRTVVEFHVLFVIRDDGDI